MVKRLSDTLGPINLFEKLSAQNILTTWGIVYNYIHPHGQFRTKNVALDKNLGPCYGLVVKWAVLCSTDNILIRASIRLVVGGVEIGSHECRIIRRYPFFQR